MSHLNVHLAAGLVIGSALSIVPVARAWLADRPVSGPIGRMAVAAFACAAWAAMPSLLTRLGAAQSIHHAAWANVFFGHALIQRRIFGGMFIGELAIAAWLVGFYLLLLLAIRRAHRRRREAASERRNSQ